MKIIIALALFLTFATALNIHGDQGLVNFEFDPSESDVFGLVMRGSIDPKNELNNKIATFLKLANYYVPVLESINNQGNNLKWIGAWTINLGPIGTVGLTGGFNLVVGWNVALNNTMSTSLGQYLDISYVPFAWGWATANASLNNWLAVGGYNATLYYSRAYVIVDLQIYGGGEVCYGGNAYFWPVQLVTNLSSSLLACQDEIIENIINYQPIDLMCNSTVPFTMTHLNISFTANMTQGLVSNACINL
jgi:hypothetical protein